MSWQPVGDQETIHVRPENVNFNRLVQGLQSIEVQEVQGWAAAEFDLKRSGLHSVCCLGALSCFVDVTQRILTGDMFQTGRIRNTVYLKKGRHRMYVHLKFKGETRFNVQIQRVPKRGRKTLHFYKPDFLPDVVALGAGAFEPDMPASDFGVGDSSAIAIPVLNLGAEWREVRFTAAAVDFGMNVTVLHVTTAPSYIIAPGQLSFVPVMLKIETPIPKSKELCPFKFQIQASSRELTDSVTGYQDNWILHDGRKTKGALQLSLRC